jgi:uncharacterized protein
MEHSRRIFLGRIAVGALCTAASRPAVGRAAEEPAFPVSPLTVETARGRFQLLVEMAETPSTWRQGLQKRRQLAADGGMMFNYHQSRIVSMWMKDTLISLDMIFIDERGFVVGIAQNTRPLSLETISSEVPVLAVLEVNAGTATRLGLKRGDRVIHAIFAQSGTSTAPAPAVSPQ